MEEMKRILVVDDDAAVRQSLDLILSHKKYQIDLVSSGQQARRALAQADYALIITDIFMPDGDGYDLVMHMRENRIMVPVVAMSGGGSSMTADWALRGAQLFCQDTIAKPFRNEEILSVVERHLNFEVMVGVGV
jgi:DNA-binding NtrC family response regulator